MREAWQVPGRRETASTTAATAAAAAVNSKAVLVTNIETGETVEYVSQSAAARALGVTSVAISNCLKRKNLALRPALLARGLKRKKYTFVLSFN